MKNINYLRLFSSCILLAISSITFAQGWEQIISDDFGSSNARYLTATVAGDYFSSGTSFGGATIESGSFVRKFDGSGNIYWTKKLLDVNTREVLPLLNGNVICITTETQSSGYSRPGIAEIDSNGDIKCQITYPFPTDTISLHFYELLPQSDGSFIYLREVGNGGKALGFIDSDYQITSEIFGTFGQEMFQLDNGNLLFPTYLDSTISIQEYSVTGDYIANVSLPEAMEFSESPNYINSDYLIVNSGSGEFIVINSTVENNLDTELDFTRYDSNGNLLMSNTFYSGNFHQIWNATLVNDGVLLNGAEGIDPGPDSRTAFCLKLTFDGVVQFYSVFDFLPGPSLFHRAIEAVDGGYICTGYVRASIAQSKEGYIVRMDDNGVLYSNAISGSVVADENFNCDYDLGETPINNWVVGAYSTGTGRLFSTNLDESGNYSIPVDSGNYEVRVYEPNAIWLTCNNNIAVNLPGFGIKDTVNFAIEENASCADMYVSAAIQTVRPCFTRTMVVTYCNYGSIVVENAYLELNLEDYYSITSASLPFTLGANNIATFELGDLDPLDCGSITIGLFLDCDATIGAAYCLEIYAFPNDPCIVDPGWSGAFLEIESSCDVNEENVVFTVKNVGTGTMQEKAGYFIVEDAVLMMLDSVDILAPNQQAVIPLMANGSTFTMSLDQVEEAPGFSMPIAFVEACGTDANGNFSLGFANQFPMNDFDPYVDVDCPIAVNAHDPNDKRGLPFGYEANHYIDKNVPIEYRVRFQNTGTDTAYNVVVRDTLDDNLDISTFREGASSHDYQLNIEGENILVYNFNNIALPDSFVNEPGSNGFFEFTITPKLDLPLEMVVKNDAAIYFDFNPPIFTNETFHTIGREFIEISVGTIDQSEFQDVTVEVFPNPFVDQTNFIINNHDATSFTLKVFDLQGRIVHTNTVRSKKIPFGKKELSSGMYIYNIESDKGFFNSGKILIK